uniref:FusA/NodT family protein n=1 Tax=Chlorobium chlorochromatii (strain CaD3) TaxID=340177 RepID=Q3ATR7_CHLCH
MTTKNFIKQVQIFSMKQYIASTLLLFLLIGNAPSVYAEVLSWEQCVAEARRAHPSLVQANAIVQQASANRRIVGSSRLPNVALALNAQQQGSSDGTSTDHIGSSLSLHQLLYDGSKTSKQLSGADEALRAAEAAAQLTNAEVRYQLRSAFVALLKAQELVELTNEIAERRQKNLRLIRLRYNGGREHIGSLRQAEADVAEATFEVEQAKRELTLAQRHLALALGRQKSVALRVQGSLQAAPFSLKKPDIEQLLTIHPATQQAAAQSRAARYELEASRSAFSPTLALTSSLGRTAASYFPLESVDWQAGLSLAVPIYSGGEGKARVAKARAYALEQQAAAQAKVLQVTGALEAAWTRLQDAEQAIAVRRRFVEAANERATIASAQYSNGLLGFNEWMIIEDNLVNAKKRLLEASAALFVAEAQWLEAQGGGLNEAEK